MTERGAGLRKCEWDQKRGIFQRRVSEEDVVTEIVSRLWLQARVPVWRIRERIPDRSKRWQRLSTPGIPDLVGFLPKHGLTVTAEGQVIPQYGTALYIEVKRPVGGVRRAAQERFIAEAREGGCCAFFANSWDDVVRELELFGVHLIGDRYVRGKL